MSLWSPVTTLLSTGLFVALAALFYHLLVGRLADALSKIKVSVPCDIGGNTKEIRLGPNLRKLIPATGGNVWWQLFHRSVSDLGRGSEFASDRVLQRKLTSIGRFTLRTQTERNPCIISFFLAFSNQKGKQGMDLAEFERVWRKRVMDKHERFRSRISKGDDRFFEISDSPPFDLYARDVSHPIKHRVDLNERIEHYLTSKFDVRQRLWEAKISTGPLGSSGAISNYQIDNRKLGESCCTETLLMFRIHHALADGVSMSAALGDATDEADELNQRMSEILRKPSSVNVMKMFVFYVLGGIKAIVILSWRSLIAFSPFDAIIAKSKIHAGRRSTTWKVVGPMANVKQVAKSISKSATLNDVTVAMVTAAIRQQLLDHQSKLKKSMPEGEHNDPVVIPPRVNVTVPVHLRGGVLLPGESLGNKIGAFVASVPLRERSVGVNKASNRLKDVSKALKEGKSTPAHLISWSLALFVANYVPERIAKWMMRNFNAKSVCVISNVKGFPFKVHWLGRPLEFLCAFLPLPPGIPIGVVVTSYDSEIAFTVDADKRAVPDADIFGDWMLNEFKRLGIEAGVPLESGD